MADQALQQLDGGLLQAHAPAGYCSRVPAPLPTVLREWGRIGVVGFGGPPAHIALLRELVVDRRRWMSSREFEDANAACGLLPGPASTQLSIYTARRAGGPAGALLGGLAFIVPGLLMILALAAAALGDAPPEWLLALGAGAGAAVAAVAVDAGLRLVRPHPSARTIAYILLGAVAAALAGPWVVVVLLLCGVGELLLRRGDVAGAWPVVLAGSAALPALSWTALKVGALSYGGGFVIIPLMQADAVDHHGWMTDQEFLNAVAFGQLTPGPVVQTVAVVGYAAAGLGGALLASAVAFGPSFAFILGGFRHFTRLRENADARAFLDGAGPASIGAILGAAVPLALALEEAWQVAVLAAAAIALLLLRRGVVPVLLGAGAAGVVAWLAGLPIPS
ncbi:MAG: chromate transporter [Solirubrobacterales bacterium]|nr:chromate transporter [Solirubrobacterales bacterium]